MADRYVSINTKRRADGRITYASLRPTSVDTLPTDQVIVSQETDRFDTLAFQYYGNAALWWVIAQANGYVNGKMYPPPGTELTIPTI